MSVHFSSNKDSWCTPPEVLELVREFGDIGLDPCWNPDAITEPRCAIQLPEDGLAAPWGGHDLVFVNPPYGRQVGAWVEKCKEADECIALLPARTDTHWFPWHADSLAFWKGRLKFLGAPHPAPFPSTIAYWGPRATFFRRVFGGKCAVIVVRAEDIRRAVRRNRPTSTS